METVHPGKRALAPVPEYPAGPCSYAIGDIHGEVTLLRELIGMLPIRPQDTVIFLGDYLDRGEDSAATIVTLREFEQRHRCVFLRGNHEVMWLEEWNGSTFVGHSAMPGAAKTLADFGGAMPPAVGRWLAATHIDYEDEHGLYVHAGLVPGRSLANTSANHKVWGAPGFGSVPYDWGKPVVFGHWKLPEPFLSPTTIGIDTGAYTTGILTAIQLPDRTLFQADMRTRKS